MQALSAATPTSVYRQPIREAAAWTAAAFGEDPKARLSRRLSADELAAMDDLLRRTSARPAWDITSHDAVGLGSVAEDVHAVLTDGAGLIVLQGIDRGRFAKEQCERIFWAIGTFLGDATMQNPRGDRITLYYDFLVPEQPLKRVTIDLQKRADW